eukprot:6431869-Prymnesium_polylepis.2
MGHGTHTHCRTRAIAEVRGRAQQSGLPTLHASGWAREHRGWRIRNHVPVCGQQEPLNGHTFRRNVYQVKRRSRRALPALTAAC